jgi:hypothetical protein
MVFFYPSQPIIVFDTLLLLTSLLLGLAQSFHLNHWYWFTGMLVSGPLAGIMYSWFNPKTKQPHSRPPRQLSLIILMLGFTWLFIFSIIFPENREISNLLFLLSNLHSHCHSNRKRRQIRNTHIKSTQAQLTCTQTRISI